MQWQGEMKKHHQFVILERENLRGSLWHKKWVKSAPRGRGGELRVI
jgi:hypothetical protein